MDEMKENVVLNEEELNEVAGGVGAFSGRRAIKLVGVYWADTFASGRANDYLIGASDLYAEYVSGAQGKCKFRIIRYDTYMGWTVGENIRFR